MQILPPDEKFDISKVPPGREWVLNVGNNQVSGNYYFDVNFNGFSLYKLTVTLNLDFTKSSWPGIIAKTSGLSDPEPWGTWH